MSGEEEQSELNEAALRASYIVTQEIESLLERAEREAEMIRREAERDAEDMRREAMASAQRLLSRLRALEFPLGQLVVGLRDEVDNVSRELEGGKSVDSDSRELPPVAEVEPEPHAARATDSEVVAEPEAEAARATAPTAEAEPEAAAEPEAEAAAEPEVVAEPEAVRDPDGRPAGEPAPEAAAETAAEPAEPEPQTAAERKPELEAEAEPEPEPEREPEPEPERETIPEPEPEAGRPRLAAEPAPPPPAPEPAGRRPGRRQRKAMPEFDSVLREEPKGGSRRGRRKSKRTSQVFVEIEGSCAICQRTFRAGSEEALVRSGWKVSGDVGLCPDCQADRWQLPEGARLPFRRGGN